MAVCWGKAPESNHSTSTDCPVPAEVDATRRDVSAVRRGWVEAYICPLLGQNVLCQINNIIIMSALQKVPLDWIIITIFIVLLCRMAWYLHSTFWFIQISTMTFWLLSTCKYVVSFIKKYVALDNIMVFNWKDSAWIPWYYYGACPKKCGTVVYKAQWCIPDSTMLLMDYPFNYHVKIHACPKNVVCRHCVLYHIFWTCTVTLHGN